MARRKQPFPQRSRLCITTTSVTLIVGVQADRPTSHCLKTVLSTSEAWRDPARQELDRRLLTEVLGLDADAMEQLAVLRNQWSREPTVTGTKRTGPDG